jgi:outer membrane receptor protein involved in Fe transport
MLLSAFGRGNWPYYFSPTKQVQRAMKLTTITLLTACFAASFGCFAQTVTISERNVPIDRIFKTIEAQTDCIFFYDYNILRRAKNVTVHCKGVSLETALNLCFKDQPFTYTVRDKTIVVKSKELAVPLTDVPHNKKSYLTAKGIVMDVEGRPIENASIMVKGTTKGITTDTAGRFSINCEKGAILAISYIGYQMKEMPASANPLTILLNLDVKPLEQLIVGGNVVPAKRKSEVSSVSVIDSRTLESLPFQNIEQIFRGLVPGANNVQPTAFEIAQARYGSGAVSIRGSVGFEGVGIVKVIIDGVEFAKGSYNLNTIDKNNIERIEVVKGPGAATLYGTGAEGGVLLIFTKSPSRNATDITVSTSAGWQDSKWEHKGKFQQVHSFSLMQGYKNISYSIGANVNNSDTYMPDGQINQHAIYGNVKYENNRFRVALSGRRYVNNFHPNRNAIFDTSSAAFFNRPGYKLPDTTQGSIGTDQVALNMTYKVNRWWTHNAVVGWSYNEVVVESEIDHPPIRKTVFTDQSPTFRYNNTITIGENGDFHTSLLMGLDYINLRSKYAFYTSGTNTLKGNDQQENTGYFAQLSPSYKNRAFITMGLRYDVNRNFKSSINPRVGLTTILGTGPITWKPRISWGKGTTPPSSGQRYPTQPSTASVVYESNPDLRPQQQTGWDYGLEVYGSKNRFRTEVVYYDNVLTDAIFSSVTVTSGVRHIKAINSGKIENSGWEFSTSYREKGFNVSANYAITRSILREPQSGKVDPKDITYPGEQMPFIAKYTAGFMAGYRFPRVFGKSDPLSVAFNITYADGMRSNDNFRYIYDLAVYHDFSNINQYGVRYYMIEYPSVTKFNLNLDYQIIQALGFFMQVRNIDNNTTAEYINTEPSVGRGWLLGLKYHFNRTGGN